MDDAGTACTSPTAQADNSWHALSCVALSGVDTTRRHNRVARLLTEFCTLMRCLPTVEPRGSSGHSDEHPDIQLDLMDCTLLVDVTITHPTCNSHREAVAAHRSPDRVGDARLATPTSTGTTRDGSTSSSCRSSCTRAAASHAIALAVLQSMTRSLEPARCLLSTAEWRLQLMQSAAISVQRGNADIMLATLRHKRGQRRACSPSAADSGSHSPQQAACDSRRLLLLLWPSLRQPLTMQQLLL